MRHQPRVAARLVTIAALVLAGFPAVFPATAGAGDALAGDPTIGLHGDRPLDLSIPATPVPAAYSGASLAQGAAIIGASAWQAAGWTGQGVKVGIIDGGFKGLGTLPQGTFGGGLEVRCYSGSSTYGTTVADCEETATSHGTAVAETVAAAAPGARILVANPITYDDLKATVSWMASRGVQIVNASFNSGDVFEGPGDGTSPYADSYYGIVDSVVRAGALWVGAAGNSGDGGWTGGWTDTDADGRLDFAAGSDPAAPDESNGFTMQAGARIRVSLRWADSWGRAADDLDLYLYSAATGQVVARSTTTQNGSGYPVERTAFTAPTAGTYEVMVRYKGGTTPPARVDLLMVSQGIVGGFEYGVTASTLPAPADTANAGAIVVGAVDVRTPDSLETYSSRGPTVDGRYRPDLVAPDCADTSIGAFCGTSQATPFVAGAAALLLQADPALTPATLASALRGQTVPLPSASGVPDPASGFGRISLGTAPAPPTTPVTPMPTPSPTPTPTSTPLTGVRTLSGSGAGTSWRGLATSAGGRVHVVGTDTSGALGPGSVVVYRGSTDGGATFATAVRLSTGSVDASGIAAPAAHPAIAAGGSLVAGAWLEGATGSSPSTVHVATSADAGATWRTPVAVSEVGGRAGRPAIATDGVTIAVTWTDRATGRITVAVSTDGGVTWPTQVVPATTTLVPFGATVGRDGLPAVALSAGTLHLAWSSTGARLVYRRSTTLGASWSPATTLDSLAVGASRPWLAASGASVAVGYAARPRAGGRMLAYVRTSSTGGATWNARSLVAATTSLASSYPVVTVSGATVRVAYAGCTTTACTRSRLWFRQSTNRGRTWSSAVGLTSSTQNARPAGIAAPARILVLYALNGSTAATGATLYLRVR